jgi:hypothetical protein
MVYTKLNLLAFYFYGIWHLNGAAFYPLQLIVLFSHPSMHFFEYSDSSQISVSFNQQLLGRLKLPRKEGQVLVCWVLVESLGPCPPPIHPPACLSSWADFMG